MQAATALHNRIGDERIQWTTHSGEEREWTASEMCLYLIKHMHESGEHPSCPVSAILPSRGTSSRNLIGFY